MVSRLRFYPLPNQILDKISVGNETSVSPRGDAQKAEKAHGKKAEEHFRKTILIQM
jgi:hypothetical protein